MAIKKIQTEGEWQDVKVWLRKDGYGYVVDYVKELKREIDDLKEKIDLIEFYYLSKLEKKKDKKVIPIDWNKIWKTYEEIVGENFIKEGDKICIIDLVEKSIKGEL